MGTDWNKEEEDAWDNLKFDNGGFGGAANGSGSNNQQLTVNNNLYGPSTTTNSQNNDGWNNGKNNKKAKNDGWLGGGNNSYGSGGSSGNWTNNISNNLKHGVHHLPFFNPGQRFFGHTIYSLLERPKANFSDVVDRINCCWVPMTFIFFAGALSAQLFGIAGAEPIHCLESKELNDKEMAYAIDYCQSKNLYYVSSEEGIPWSNKEREKRQLGYYHWVPLMMFLQALAFMMPNFLWFHMNQLSGIEYVKFLIEATKLKNPGNVDPTHPERQKHLKSLAARISEAVLDRDAFMVRRFVGYRLIQPKGAFVSFLYVSIKLLYLGNACAQFLLLNTFIGGGYRWWGYDVLQALVNGANWQDSPVFPRLSLCDVPLRKLGDVTRHTLQCHLRINTYNEKVYLFIWWAILVVAAITFFNFLYYLVVLLLLPNSQECSVRHLLKERRHKPILQSVSRADRKLIKSFANDVLCKDGVLLFWFIETHAGTVVARELFSEVFETCKEQMHCDNDLLPCEIVVDGPGKKCGGSYSSDSSGSGTAETDAGDGWKQQRAIGFVTPSAPGLWAFNGHPKGGAVQFI